MSIQKVFVPTLSPEAREIWFEADGARLFALENGHGSPVVFLHGGLADHRAAVFRVGGLAETHRLLTPDLRGSGRSVHRGELSWDRLADDVAALLEHLGTDRAVVGGTSMGSAIALRFALRHSHLLNGLILMSALYSGADRPLSEAAMMAMRTMKEAGERALEHGIAALRPLFEPLPPPIRDLALEMMLGFDPASVAATTRFLGTNQQPMASLRELESIDVPVLVLPGADPQHPPEVASLYAEHLRHPIVVEQSAPDMMERLGEFCTDVSF
jgi:3-oxoadipate enol-lactonase